MRDIQFPAVLDATMFKAYKRCPRHFWHNYVEGLRLEEGSIHLLAGKAFAKGVEVARKEFYVGGSGQEEAIELGLDSLVAAYGPDRPAEKKNLTRMEEAFYGYFQKFPLSTTEGIVPLDLGVESTFSFEIPGLVHPDTGKPLLYAGRRDMIGQEKGSDDPFGNSDEEIWMVDEKTGGYISEGWQYDFELDWQFLGYMYYERFVNGSPVKGVEIRKGCLTRAKYDVKLDWDAKRITYKDELLKDWYDEMQNTAVEIVYDYQQQYRDDGEGMPFSQVFGNACNEYKGCEYKPICRKSVLPEYKIHRWNPLAKED